jgi:hypothetical protein
MEGIPVFDFSNPWVALIQLVLFYVLPRVVGLVTDKLTKASTKIALLGLLAVATSALTWLLDVAVANGWATLDWTALINVIVNAAITFALANAVYRGVIKPTGQAATDAANKSVQLFGPDKPAPKLYGDGEGLFQ